MMRAGSEIFRGHEPSFLLCEVLGHSTVVPGGIYEGKHLRLEEWFIQAWQGIRPRAASAVASAERDVDLPALRRHFRIRSARSHRGRNRAPRNLVADGGERVGADLRTSWLARPIPEPIG